MITDNTGAVVSTHDYYPFGEVMKGVSSFNTHQFTGHERDSESGADYMLARHYGSATSRFMSIDPLNIIALQNGDYEEQREFDNFLEHPQSWNRYTYVLNNPLRFTDPTGQYTCSGNECDKVATALANIRNAAGKLKAGSKGRLALEKVLTFFGKEGEKNGVDVKTKTGQAVPGSTITTNGQTTITLDFGVIAQGVNNIGGGSTVAAESAATVAHEGQHGLQQTTIGMSQTRLQTKGYEVEAFTTQSYVNQGLGVNSVYGVWTTSKGFDATAVDKYAELGTQWWCGATKLCK